MMLVVSNLKGGSGKSFLAALLTLEAIGTGLRVAAVDLDPQASLTRMLTGVEGVESAAVIPEPMRFRGALLYPANPLLEDDPRIYENPAQYFYAVRGLFRDLEADLVVVDTPNQYYPFVRSVLRALRGRRDSVVVSPVGRGPWTLGGAGRLRKFMETDSPGAKHVLVINNVYARSVKKIRERVEKYASLIGSRVLRSWIPRRVELEDSTAMAEESPPFTEALAKYPEVRAAAREVLRELLELL